MDPAKHVSPADSVEAVEVVRTGVITVVETGAGVTRGVDWIRERKLFMANVIRLPGDAGVVSAGSDAGADVTRGVD